MRFPLAASLLALILVPVATARAADGNRLTYLDRSDPYYVSRTFPKLVTPQWVGEKGVEAVVILAIDDMRDPARYEKFLRPILRRLKKIDGRAPVSIMCNRLDPKHPQLPKFLKEGLSLETHTLDHPCPFFRGGDFAKAKKTYEGCVDLLEQVPGNKPVAFRMPCCDSLNTPSPRFWAEIFNKVTSKGNFLTIDSSVFNVFTANDPELPRDLVLNPDGSERFRKYLPADRSFVNTIEDYPYPYVIGRLCWQFPCVTPSDWQASHLHKANNPQTVKDWKAALDCTVIKQGVFCLVFHPHGWIKNEQVVDLIDYAVARHGKKVKFLTFREAQQRLDKNLLGGQPLRNPTNGLHNGVRLLDLNNDGYLDVVIGNEHSKQTRLWSPKKKKWEVMDCPADLSKAADNGDHGWFDEGRFGFLKSQQYPSIWFDRFAWHFDGKGWGKRDLDFGRGLVVPGQRFLPRYRYRDAPRRGVRLIDLDGDGRSEIIWDVGDKPLIFAWSEKKKSWVKLPFTLPRGATLTDGFVYDQGVRFLDLDGDGKLDIVFSNEKEYGIYLFTDLQKGWSRKVIAGKRSDKNALPMISHKGTNNGFWVHSRQFWWSNEHTPLLKDHVDRQSINELLGNIDLPALSAEASLRSIHLRPGFEVELVAAEPLVQSPITFAWGADGKLWVVEMGDYPLGVDGKGKPGGRVKYLEDTKGTGKYDKATVFLDKLPFPTGVMPWGKGVLVTCAPRIFYAEDTKGTGKADRIVTLYTGFNEGNQQHRVNSLVWGLDNWVYCANGDSGGRVKSVTPLLPPLRKGGRGGVVDIRGRDFRIRPDDGAIDLQTGQTQYGRCRDDWGNWFGCNNSNSMWHFVLADHYLRRNRHLAPPDPRVSVPVVPGSAPVFPVSRTLPRFNDPHAANHFTSACSVIVYRDELFGPVFAGNSFVSEPVHNLVHREIMTPRGVTFSSRRAADEQRSEFLASSDNWFRPTTIQTGPDGALWVADMYRQVIEHPEWIPKDWQKRLDLRAGHDKGRIYRVYPVGKRPRAIPRLDRLDVKGLVAALDSPSGWQRDTAQQLLVRKRDKSAVPLLEKLALECKRPLGQLHALCTLDGLGALKPALLRKALADSHPGVRRHAVRLCESNLARSPELGTALLKLQGDPDVQVRMQLAYSLGEWEDERAGRALGELALKHADDRYFLAAVLSSVHKKNLETVLLTVLAGSRTSGPPAGLTTTLFRLADAFGNKRVTATLLKAIATPEKGRYAPWRFTALAGLLDTLDRRNTSLAKMQREGDEELRASLERLGGLFTAVRASLANRKAPREEQLRAVRLLGRGLDKQAEDRKTLAGLLIPQTAEDLQAAAVDALGRLRDPEVPVVLLRGWKGYGPALRSRVLDVLWQRPEWVKAALDALRKEHILPFEIDAVRRQRLLQHRDAAIRQRAVKLFAGAVNADREKVIKSYRAALSLKGDARRGLPLFTKHCATCHRLGGVGHEVGPDLASVGDKSPMGLLVAILDPNRAVEARYLNYTATLKNGLNYSGVLANESGNSITLVEPEGKKRIILRTDLSELYSSNKSVMPEGLEKDLKVQDLADLIAFLRSKLPAPNRKTFAGNKPELVRHGSDGVLNLSAANCEIYGKTLVLEPKYGNLGYWSSADDQAVWSVQVARAGKFAVWLDFACAAEAAGNIFVLEAGVERLTGKVPSTGSWDTYRQRKVGEIRLEAGRQKVVMRAAGKVKGALIDLRGMNLVPVKSE
jgi:putative membrane-bound dehydrogenase-like protein